MMRQLFATFGLVVLTAVPSWGQTLTLSADLSTLPGYDDYGPSILNNVDEDGDGNADSFLQEAQSVVEMEFAHDGLTLTYPMYRLIRLVDNQVCWGKWINPKQLAGVNGTWNVYYSRVMLVNKGTRQELRVRFDTDATGTNYTWKHVRDFAIDRKWEGCQ